MCKAIILPFLLVLFSSVFIACEKSEYKPNRLSHGHGTWQIESIEYIYYDSVGNETSTETFSSNLGEILVMEGNWGSSNIRLAKYIYEDSVGTLQLESISLTTDGDRLDVYGTTAIGLEGLYTVEKFGRNNQEWVGIRNFANPEFENRIELRKTVTLKHKKD